MPTLKIEEGFVSGLRTSLHNRRNTQALLECRNMKPTEDGLISQDPPTFPPPLYLSYFAETGLKPIYPFPKLHWTRDHCFLADATHVWEVNTTTWALTDITPRLIPVRTNLIPNPRFKKTGGGAYDTWEIIAGVWEPAGFSDPLGAHLYTPELGSLGISCSPAITATTKYRAIIRGYAYTAGNINIWIGGTAGGNKTSGTGYFELIWDITSGAAPPNRCQINAAVPFEGYITQTIVVLNDVADPISIPSGGPRHVMDFGPNLALINETSTIILLNGSYYIDEGPKPTTGCNFRGRAIYGGFQGSGIPEWETFWDTELEGFDTPTDADKSLAVKWNFLRTLNSILTGGHVWWSSIGAADEFMFHFPEILIEGPNMFGYGHDEVDHPYISEILLRAEQGSRVMPRGGQVLAIHPLESAVIVYTTDGVFALTPIENPVPSFGLTNIDGPAGIPGRGCAGGNLHTHVCVDADGLIWRIRNDLVAEKLDYREYTAQFTDLAATEIHYDSNEKDFYIAGDTKTFVLSQTGLGEGIIFIMSVVRKQGILYGIWGGLPPPSNDIRIRTDTLDFGNRGSKTIKGVFGGISTSGDEALSVSTYYRNKGDGSWRKIGPVPLTPEGTSGVFCSGVEAQFELTADNLNYVDTIDYLAVEVDETGRKKLGALLDGPQP